MGWWRQLTRKIKQSLRLRLKQGRIRETRRVQVWQGGLDMGDQVRLMGRLGQQLIAEIKEHSYRR